MNPETWVRVPIGAYTRLAQLVERTPFKRVVVGSSPTSGEGERQSLGLEPEVSVEMEGHYPNKRCLTVLSEIRGERGLRHGCRIFCRIGFKAWV